jgi:hypothetical protein
MTDDFVTQQASAWGQIVADMHKDPMFMVINGGSVNGPGSSLEYTRGLRAALPGLLRHYDITMLLDAPCGDCGWLKNTDLSCLDSYIGIDVNQPIIDANRRELGHYKAMTFICANLLTRKRFPKVHAILCRDFLAHLPTEQIMGMVNKFEDSGSRYLLASNYPGADNTFDYAAYLSANPDVPWAGYMERPHDLTAAPFHLKRVDGIDEMSPPGGVIAQPHELALFELHG